MGRGVNEGSFRTDSGLYLNQSLKREHTSLARSLRARESALRELRSQLRIIPSDHIDRRREVEEKIALTEREIEKTRSQMLAIQREAFRVAWA